MYVSNVFFQECFVFENTFAGVAPNAFLILHLELVANRLLTVSPLQNFNSGPNLSETLILTWPLVALILGF